MKTTPDELHATGSPTGGLGLRHGILALVIALVGLVPIALIVAALPADRQGPAALALMELGYVIAALAALAWARDLIALRSMAALPAASPTLGFATAGAGILLLNTVWSAPLYDETHLALVADTIDTMISNIGTVGAVISLGLVAPACEEFLFRGVLLRALRARLGPGLSILLAAVAFGLFHLHPVHAAVATALGLVCGVAASRGSLWFAVAVHAANNTVALIWSLAAPSAEPGWPTGVLGAALVLSGLALGVGRSSRAPS